MEELHRVIAIDFDGTLCENKWPEIGAPIIEVIEAAKREKANGSQLILLTMREGRLLDEALMACKQWGLTFDAVNDNTKEWKVAYGNNPRKIGATEYWDDRAVNTITSKAFELSCKSAFHFFCPSGNPNECSTYDDYGDGCCYRCRMNYFVQQAQNELSKIQRGESKN